MALTKIGKEGITGISNASNANAITIDASENVGIGTNSPSSILHTNNTADAPNGITIQNSSASGTADSYVQFKTNTANVIMGIDATGTDVFKISNSTALGTSDVLTIDSAGNVLVGKTSTDIAVDGCRLASFGAILTRAGNEPLRLNRRTSNGTITKFDKDGSTVGTISVTGSATAYNTSSDYRLKENVDYTWDATTRLKQLKPARFNFIADADRTVDGFLAHEVSSIVPEAITGTKDAMTTEILYVEGDELPEGVSIGDVKEASVPDYQGIDQSKLVPLLVKTIQELEARITALEA